MRVDIEPALRDWAVDRSGRPSASIAGKFPWFKKWLDQGKSPTFKQLQDFAKYTFTPLGYLYLQEPPVEDIPIPDFRTLKNAGVTRPSPNLLDTIHGAQDRQEWFRGYALAEGFDELPFVGSFTSKASVKVMASELRKALHFEVADRASLGTWTDARSHLIKEAGDLGVLVMVSDIVGNNTHRSLDPQEFRGFALADPVAPLVFVNGADTKAAQIFTIVHELAHIWAGDTGLSDADMSMGSGQEKELWANRVAAEVLIPTDALKDAYHAGTDSAELDRLAKRFRVSTLAALKKVFDDGYLSWDEYQERYQGEFQRVLQFDRSKGGKGGNYYKTQPLRLSRNFARAVISDTLEGRTSYRDAYALLGTQKHSTFEKLAEEVLVS